MDKKNLLIFSLILVIALFLRFYQISNLPPSLNWDEVSIGYNAYSILKTGRDEWGQFLPLSFRAFGDYKLPLYIYLDVPFVALLGLNELAVRLPSVIAGIGVVVLTFLILKELTKSVYLSFWGMFLSSILPWLVTFSRVALEANLALFLTMAAFYVFLKSERIKVFLPLSAILLGLSAFSYNSSRVLILPFITLSTIFLFKPSKTKGTFITLIILFGLTTMAFFQAFTVDSGARYRWTTILDEGAITKINQLRGSSRLPEVLNQFVYNKATSFIIEASKNYLSHFNPNFLFSRGGSNYQFSIPGVGQLYFVMLPVILLGIWQMLKMKEKWQLFILSWLLIAPIPGAITRDAPHSLRTIFLAIPLLFSAVMGIKWSKDFLPAKIFQPMAILVVLVLLGSTSVFWQNYAGDYRKDYSWSWQYGYKEALEFVKAHQDDYERIVFSKIYGEPHEFLLFYLRYDPHKYQSDPNLIRYQQSDWFWVDKFDKYQFINDWEIKDKVSVMKSTLLITSPQNYPTNSQILKSINFLDGRVAFDIVAVN